MGGGGASGAGADALNLLARFEADDVNFFLRSLSERCFFPPPLA